MEKLKHIVVLFSFGLCILTIIPVGCIRSNSENKTSFQTISFGVKNSGRQYVDCEIKDSQVLHTMNMDEIYSQLGLAELTSPVSISLVNKNNFTCTVETSKISRKKTEQEMLDDLGYKEIEIIDSCAK